MKSNIDAQKAIVMINKVCSTIENLEYKEIQRLFVENKIPYYSSLIPYFIKKGYLERKTNNLYSWVKEEPVYYKEIEHLINTTRNKKKLNRIENITEGDAIAFLKSKGYKIMKPIVEYTEI